MSDPVSTQPAAISTVVPLAPGATPAVVLLAKDQPANGIIRILLRANNDPASDSHAMFWVKPDTTAADIQKWVTEEKARVAGEYAAAALAHQTLLDAID